MLTLTRHPGTLKPARSRASLSSERLMKPDSDLSRTVNWSLSSVFSSSVSAFRDIANLSEGPCKIKSEFTLLAAQGGSDLTDFVKETASKWEIGRVEWPKQRHPPHSAPLIAPELEIADLIRGHEHSGAVEFTHLVIYFVSLSVG